MIKAQPEPLGDIRLNTVHFGAVFRHGLARFRGGQLGGSAVLVGGTQEHHLVAPATIVAGIQVRGQLRAHKIAQVLDSVDVGNRRSDENPCHIRFRLMSGVRLSQLGRQQKTTGDLGPGFLLFSLFAVHWGRAKASRTSVRSFAFTLSAQQATNGKGGARRVDIVGPVFRRWARAHTGQAEYDQRRVPDRDEGEKRARSIAFDQG